MGAGRSAGALRRPGLERAGAALPGSGGSYHFLKDIYGRLDPTWGRLIPFLFIWQFLFSGTCETASAYIGGLKYLEYAIPGLEESARCAGTCPAASTRWRPPSVWRDDSLVPPYPRARPIESVLLRGNPRGPAVGDRLRACPISTWRLLRVPAGTYECAQRTRTLPAGLGAAMTIAIYDYFGYYNICFLGDEVRRTPAKRFPRAVISSVWIIGILYILMTVAIIGVIPWQEAAQSEAVAANLVGAESLVRCVATAFAWLVVWTALAGVFAMSLGYSRIPFAAARNGDFFNVFGTLHSGGFPVVSIVCLGVLTAAACYLPLDDVIDAAVAVRILVQFIGQIVGLHILRTTRPDFPLPFRMRLYPLPSLIALVGWLFVLATQKPFVLEVTLGDHGWPASPHFSSGNG